MSHRLTQVRNAVMAQQVERSYRALLERGIIKGARAKAYQEVALLYEMDWRNVRRLCKQTEKNEDAA